MRKSMQKFLNSNLRPGLVVFGLAAFGLSGCSTITSGVDAVGEGVVSLGHKVQKATTDIKTEQVSEEVFYLSQTFHEPVENLDSIGLRLAAKQACPKGYIHLSRNARRAGPFAEHHAQCESDQACGYQLEWRIKCQEVPYEPFSLFGKTS